MVIQATSHGVYRVWQAGGGYDKNLWSWDWIREKARYCHENPVKRRLVRAPGQWRWSSYRWLVEGQRAGEPLAVDDWVVGERLAEAGDSGLAVFTDRRPNCRPD